MKILRYITVALMLLQAAVARAETITSGNFQYEIVEFMGYDEEEAVVVGLAEGFVPSGQLAFPSTIKYNGKNVKVVGIGWSNHAGHEGDAPVIGGQTGITSVKIPRYMRFIGCIEFKDCPNIERYEVESGATVYTVNGDALVEISDNNGKAYHRLKRYPSAAKSPTYVVPATIDGIEFGAFAANAHLKRIYLVGGQRLGECWQSQHRGGRLLQLNRIPHHRQRRPALRFNLHRLVSWPCLQTVHRTLNLPISLIGSLLQLAGR